MSPSVAIIQRRLTHYRVPLFNQLRSLLSDRGVSLRLLHGTPTESELLKKDSGYLDWAEILPTRYIANDRLMWQPFAAVTAACQLTIFPQENKHLNNIPILFTPWRNQKIAFWGHGRNMQAASQNSLGERFKRWTTNRVDWWFAYTDLSAEFVRNDGFNSDRITVLNNSIDTSELQRSITHAAREGKPALRNVLGLPPEGPVGLFIGSLYQEKRLDFLVEAAIEIRQQIPNFQMIFAGDGPQRSVVESATHLHDWIKWLGPVQGDKKAQCLAVADILLNPGLVGLGILDAFVAGLPMVTTDCGLHSPEIAYLESGVNGLMTNNSPTEFAVECCQLLMDKQRMARLEVGARESAQFYSVEIMAQRFSSGICAALSAVSR